MKEVSKRFFFEKKPVRAAKQKTFAPGPCSFQRQWPSLQKFFASFFQKRSAYFLLKAF
jgi:hypothetical protein